LLQMGGRVTEKEREVKSVLGHISLYDHIKGGRRRRLDADAESLWITDLLLDRGESSIIDLKRKSKGRSTEAR